MNKGIFAGKALKFIFSSNKVVSSVFSKIINDSLCKADVSVETSANSGTTLGNLIDVLQRLHNTLFSLLKLVDVGGKLLTKSQRSCILGMCSANFDNIFKLFLLLSEGFSKALKLGK